MTRACRHFGVVLVASAGWVACGASYQSVYEGDVRFEHCYRLDSDSSISASAKLACWSEWNHNYTRGQTRDRVEYGLTRERQLLGGDTKLVGPLVPPIDDHAKMLDASASGPSIACPLPSSPFEAPPATLAPLPAPVPVAASASAKTELTGTQLCVQDCGNAFTACATKCKKTTCINKCGDLAKACIAQCL